MYANQDLKVKTVNLVIKKHVIIKVKLINLEIVHATQILQVIIARNAFLETMVLIVIKNAIVIILVPNIAHAYITYLLLAPNMPTFLHCIEITRRTIQ